MPEHLQEVKQRKEDLIIKTIKAVKERLTKEIYYWDQQAEQMNYPAASGRGIRIKKEPVVHLGVT